ncbi:MAG: thiamine diphosphokinase [Actinomycetaceae bacterium]|nr:thiamine diphosphokinase [Actinomycetaceae bacterium]
MRCVVVGGAEIDDYATIQAYLQPTDYIIYCDSGLSHRESLHLTPDLIVGDFDSYPVPNQTGGAALPDVETIVLPREKDDTDTVFAVKEGIRRGFDDFLLIGVVGGRLDHTLGNVSILLYLDSVGKSGTIVDDYSEMEIVAKKPAFIPERYAFFSLLNVTGDASGVNIRGAKYPLDNAEITSEYQYGISNEVLPGKVAEVSVASGKLLLIKVRVNTYVR